MKSKFAVLLSCAAALLIGISTGCQTSRTMSNNGVPSKNYLVGGGYNVDFTAPAKGIAYVVEETTQRVIQLKSMDRDDRFRAEIDNGEDSEKILGIKPSAARFTFYFVPEAVAIPSIKDGQPTK